MRIYRLITLVLLGTTSAHQIQYEDGADAVNGGAVNALTLLAGMGCFLGGTMGANDDGHNPIEKDCNALDFTKATYNVGKLMHNLGVFDRPKAKRGLTDEISIFRDELMDFHLNSKLNADLQDRLSGLQDRLSKLQEYVNKDENSKAVSTYVYK